MTLLDIRKIARLDLRLAPLSKTGSYLTWAFCGHQLCLVMLCGDNLATSAPVSY